MTGQLQLTTPGLHADDLGVTTPTALTADTITTALGALGRIGQRAHWLIGDLVVELEVRSSLPEALTAAAAQLGGGWDQATVAKAVVTSKRIPRDRRRPDLSWSHHQAVAEDEHMTDDDQRVWLGKAAAHGWTVRQLRDQLAAATDRDGQQRALDGLARVPRPPESKVRAILERFGDDAWVLWQPATGTVRPAGERVP